MLLLNIITIGLDTNYNNLQGSSTLFLWQGASKFDAVSITDIFHPRNLISFQMNPLQAIIFIV